MKKFLSCLLSLSMVLAMAIPAAAASYRDVPADSALAGEVQKAVDSGLMSGYNSTTFGYADPMTRMQFVTVLWRMDDQSKQPHTDVSYITPQMQVDTQALHSRSPDFLLALNHAAHMDILDRNVPFRPDAPITRREMSEMLVRSLGLKSAAKLAEQNAQLPFTDVTSGKGYISVAYDIGMTKGVTSTTFAPNANATRAQAAAMLVRIHEKLKQRPAFSHGFYAINSHSQLELAKQMNAVSVGWSRMKWDGSTALLATTSANGNELCIPAGYQDVVNTLKDSGVSIHLNVYMDTTDGLADLLSSDAGRKQAVDQILNELTIPYRALGRNPYDGVTIDFEGLRQSQKADFTAFLNLLSRRVHETGKKLFICVSPVLTTGSYYDGYDYTSIGVLADKVILMAYDYDSRNMGQFLGTDYQKTAATAPIDQVYWSMKAATDQIAPDKLLLGYSCKNTAWKIDGNGKLLESVPVHPTASTVAARLAQADTVLGWSGIYQQSYAMYTGDDGARYFLWYQDGKSVQSSLNAAKLLGISGTSLWRLGELPAWKTADLTWTWQSLL